MKVYIQLLKGILIIILITSCSIFDFDGSTEISNNLWKVTVPSLSFGESVDISGDYAIVGSSNDSTGCVYVFERTDKGWPRKCALKHNDKYIGDFGKVISIDDIFVVVGDPKNQCIYCYSRTDSGWVEEPTIYSPDQGIFQGFGYSVDILNNQLAVGSLSGPVVVYNRNSGSWIKREELDFNNSLINRKIEVRISDQLIAISKEQDVNIFMQSETEWISVKNLQPFDSTGFTDCKSIAVYDNIVVVGDYSVNDFSGRIFIFEFDEDVWRESTIDRGWGYDRFGHSVGIYSDYLIVGNVPEKPIFYGNAYIYNSNENLDTLLWEEKASYSKSRDCGWNVAIDKKHAIFSGTGCAYIYEYK